MMGLFDGDQADERAGARQARGEEERGKPHRVPERSSRYRAEQDPRVEAEADPDGDGQDVEQPVQSTCQSGRHLQWALSQLGTGAAVGIDQHLRSAQERADHWRPAGSMIPRTWHWSPRTW